MSFTFADDPQVQAKRKKRTPDPLATDFGGATNPRGTAAPIAAPSGGALDPSPTRVTAPPLTGAPTGPDDPSFWVSLPNGDVVPFDHPLASTPGVTQPGDAGPVTPGEGNLDPARSNLPFGSNLAIGGAGGDARLTSSQTGDLTGTAPEIPLGSTLGDDPVEALMRTRLLELLGQDLTNVSVDDPTLAPAARAFRDARLREQQRANQASFERLAAQGLASSGAANRAAGEEAGRAGRDIASFEAGLVLDELENRRQMLDRGVEIAGQLGLAEEQRNLSRQLAGINAQMQLFQLGQSELGRQATLSMAHLNSQDRRFLADLDAQLRREGFSLAERLNVMDNEVRRYGIDVSGNLGLLGVMTDLLQLEQQNIQFNDQLGFLFSEADREQHNLNLDRASGVR